MNIKFLISLIPLLIAVISFSQPNVDFYSFKTEKGIGIYANNPEYCPVSVKMNFNLKNLAPTTGKQDVFVIPARSNKFLMTELLKVDSNGGYSYSYKFNMNYGDINQVDYDTAYEYDLPFEKGTSHKLFQGYFGKFSHQSERALDFTMPEGTNVVAARDGIVVAVVQNNTRSCPYKTCLPYTNYVNIYHSDGTFDSYCHIKHNGSKVNVGDSVKQGDVIAISGNTGFTSGPHLHFVCYLGGLKDRRSVETYFKTNDGTDVTTLEENEIYFKNY